MKTFACFSSKLCLLVILMNLVSICVSQTTFIHEDTIQMKTTSWGIDEIFGTQNSYSQEIKISEISEQEYQQAKEKVSIIKSYPSYYEELKAITDSFCKENNIKDPYSLQTHYLLSEQHLKNKGLSDHVKIDFRKWETENGYTIDSSHYLILLQASNNIVKQIQVSDLYGFYFGECFNDYNIFEINLTCEFGPMGELLFNTKEGYLFKTEGELIYMTEDSLLLFATDFKKYIPGPIYLTNKIEFYNFEENDLYCFDMDSVVAKLDRNSNSLNKEPETFWGISDFFVVRRVKYYNELKVVFYDVYVTLSGVIHDGENNYSIVENKYYKMNPRDVVIKKKTH